MSRVQGRVVALLRGGRGSEREVSLATGEAMRGALERLGCVVHEIDIEPEDLRRLFDLHPDCAVLALHGAAGEDGRVQGLLDMFGIPYSGSGVLASALAIDKVRSKWIFESAEIPTPDWVVLDEPAASAPFVPCVAKRSCEGSSVGVQLVHEESDWSGALALEGRGAILVERMIHGRELTVAVFDDRILGVLEIRTVSGRYDYEAKYHRSDNVYTVLSSEDPVDGDMVRETAALGRRSYDVLACRGLARVDVLWDEDGPWVLEVNTLPGMTGSSLVPKIAAEIGWDFDRLVEEIVLAARCDEA